jgi:hypothetical protein
LEWDRVAGFTLAAVGGVLVVAGGLAAQGAPTTIDSLSYIATAGLIGLFCLGLGVGLFLSADLHDEWHKLDRIEAAIRGEPRADAEEILDLVSRTGTADAVPSGSLLATAGDGSGGRGRSGLTAAVALNRGVARLLPVILLAPLAVMSLGISQASSSGEFTDSARGVWVAALGVAVTFGLIGLNTGRMRARISRRRVAALSPYAAVGVARREAGGGRSADRGLWVVDGLRHFHRGGCPALAGLEPKPLARHAVGAELVPCGLCGAGG